MRKNEKILAYVKKKQYLCSGKGFIINTTMARPIRETPILFGDEARRFETQMLNPKPISAERKARMQSDYEFLRSRCVNCAF